MATGVLVESHMARPTKIEGNPDHPGSLGATDAFAQACVLGLYDPDRSQAEIHDGRIGSWAEFQQELSAALGAEKGNGGSGLRLLTPTITSPSLGDQIGKFLKTYPSAKWVQYESVTRDNVREGAKLAFGEYVNAVYRVDQADVILTLDSDFLTSGPGCAALCARICAKAARRRYRLKDEPAVRGGIHADEYRRDGRSSPAFARVGNRKLCACAGPRTWA